MVYIHLLLGSILFMIMTAALYYLFSHPFQYKLIRKMYMGDVQSKKSILLKRGCKEEEIDEMSPAKPITDHFAWQYALSLIIIAFFGICMMVIYFHNASILLTKWLGFSHFWADFTKYIFMIQLIVPYAILEIGYLVVYLYFNRYVKNSHIHGYKVTFDLNDYRNFARTWLTRMENHEKSSNDYFRRTIDPTIGICYIILIAEIIVMFFIRLFS